MYIKKLLFIFIFSFIGINVVYSQPSQYWIKYFTNGRFEYTRDLVKDNNGDYIITGTSMVSLVVSSNYGVVTVKYDSLGHQIWINTIDDSSHDEDPYQILLDDSNDVYIFGIKSSDSLFLMKYDMNGNEKWYKEFNSSIIYYQSKYRACIDENGNVYCAGTNESNGRELTFVRKYSSNGDLLWFKEFQTISATADEPYSIIYDGHKFLYLAGGTLISDTTRNPYCAKIDKDGNLSWARNYSSLMSSNRIPIKIVLTNDSNLYMMGISRANYNDYDFDIMKLDSSGNKIWENFVAGNAGLVDVPNDIIVDLNSDVYVTGFVTQLIEPYSTQQLFTIIKYNNAGDIIWNKFIDDSLHSQGKGISLTLDISNNLYVAGSLGHTPNFIYNMQILKYTPDGDSIWAISKDYNQFDYTPVKMLLNSGDDFTAILNGLKSFVTLRYSDIPQKVDDEFFISNFELQQNYPNPFNPNTTISYSIPEASNVRIDLYDVLGNKIQILVDEYKSTGKYSVEFNGSELSSGIYFYKFSAGNFHQTKKMLLLK